MNAYELIMKIKSKMNDPVFADRFNKLIAELNTIPGLQDEVIKIAQIKDDKKRKRSIDKLPSKAKNVVEEVFKLLN
jgi:hypothetical protein